MPNIKHCPFKGSFDSIYTAESFATEPDNLGNLGCSVKDCRFHHQDECGDNLCGINEAYKLALDTNKLLKAVIEKNDLKV